MKIVNKGITYEIDVMADDGRAYVSVYGLSQVADFGTLADLGKFLQENGDRVERELLAKAEERNS